MDITGTNNVRYYLCKLAKYHWWKLYSIKFYKLLIVFVLHINHLNLPKYLPSGLALIISSNARCLANELMIHLILTFDHQILGGFKFNIGICIPTGNYKCDLSLKLALKSLRYLLVRLRYIDKRIAGHHTPIAANFHQSNDFVHFVAQFQKTTKIQL